MRTRLEIKRIELFSLFKIAFFLYAVIGLLMGLCYGFFLLAASFLETAFVDEAIPGFGFLGGMLGLVLIPIMAVFYGAFGSVFVTIGGFLYNMFARFIGGIRLETDAEVAEEPTAPPVEEGPPTI